ncbi:hypothetical protein GCM10009106_17270 [Sphingomonas japonica]
MVAAGASIAAAGRMSCPCADVAAPASMVAASQIERIRIPFLLFVIAIMTSFLRLVALCETVVVKSSLFLFRKTGGKRARQFIK